MTSAASDSKEEINAEVESLRRQLQEARDDAELNLLMLQQTKQQVDVLRTTCEEDQQLLKGYQEQLARAESLITALLERLEQSQPRP